MKTVQLKTAQQFCESVYHKYALALEEKQAKQHRYFLIAQRSAAAAAAVTLVVGASVLAFRQKDGKLSPAPSGSLSASKEPAEPVLISLQTVGLSGDNNTNSVSQIPNPGQFLCNAVLSNLIDDPENADALFRLSLSIYASDGSITSVTEEDLPAIFSRWEEMGITVEGPSDDVSGQCIVTVSKEQIWQLPGDDLGVYARLAPAPRAEGYDRRLGDLAVSWAETAGEQDTVFVSVYTVWDSSPSNPNLDLFREADLVEAVEDIVPLPRPELPLTWDEIHSEPYLSLERAFFENQELIANTGEAFIRESIDSLLARAGVTDLGEWGDIAVAFGTPDLPHDFEGEFTWEGNISATGIIYLTVTKEQLLQLGQDPDVRYVFAKPFPDSSGQGELL